MLVSCEVLPLVSQWPCHVMIDSESVPVQVWSLHTQQVGAVARAVVVGPGGPAVVHLVTQRLVGGLQLADLLPEVGYPGVKVISPREEAGPVPRGSPTWSSTVYLHTGVS